MQILLSTISILTIWKHYNISFDIDQTLYICIPFKNDVTERMITAVKSDAAKTEM
jgi:hypothetical protein